MARLRDVLLLGVAHRPSGGLALDAHHSLDRCGPGAQRAEAVARDTTDTTGGDAGVTSPLRDPVVRLPARRVLLLLAFLVVVFWFARPVLLPLRAPRPSAHP